METKRAVGAVVFREDGAVLVVRRAKPPAIFSWTLPGGRVEDGESLEAAIVREMREETSLVVEPVRVIETLVLSQDEFSYRITDFLCRVVSGVARAGDDASEIRWVLPVDFDGYALTEDVRRVITAGTKPSDSG